MTLLLQHRFETTAIERVHFKINEVAHADITTVIDLNQVFTKQNTAKATYAGRHRNRN